MKYTILTTATLLFMVGCSTTKVSEPLKPAEVKPVVSEVIEKPFTRKIAGFKEVEYMQRPEVIQATKDCIDARMRPIVQTIPQRTEHGTVMLPVMVNCEIYNFQKQIRYSGYSDEQNSEEITPMRGVNVNQYSPPVQGVEVSQYKNENENEFNYDRSQYKDPKVWPDPVKIFRLEQEKTQFFKNCTVTPKYARENKRWSDPNFRREFEVYLHNECAATWAVKEESRKN